MNFSKLRHRIIFLEPTDIVTNELGESVPRYRPFKPYVTLNARVTGDDVFFATDNDGNGIFVYKDGRTYAHKMALNEFSVAAFVTPTTGREYEESQKLRAETTYKISTRFFRGINSTHRIYYAGREFEIISVLDLNERHEELQIVASEKDKVTAQNFGGDTYGEE